MHTAGPSRAGNCIYAWCSGLRPDTSHKCDRDGIVGMKNADLERKYQFHRSIETERWIFRICDRDHGKEILHITVDVWRSAEPSTPASVTSFGISIRPQPPHPKSTMCATSHLHLRDEKLFDSRFLLRSIISQNYFILTASTYRRRLRVKMLRLKQRAYSRLIKFNSVTGLAIFKRRPFCIPTFATSFLVFKLNLAFPHSHTPTSITTPPLQPNNSLQPHNDDLVKSYSRVCLVSIRYRPSSIR